MAQSVTQNEKGYDNSVATKREWNSKKSNWNKNDKSSTIKRNLLMRKGTKWYSQKLTDLTKSSQGNSLPRDQITQLRTEAIDLLKADYYVYDEQKSTASNRDDFEWISTVLSSGTVSDKLAAHTVLIQDSPIHNLRSLEILLRFVNTKGKRECIMAIDNLRDLFVGDLLIPKEKMKTFEELVNSVETRWIVNKSSNKYDRDRERFLVISHVEDQIRSNYKKFLEALVTVSHDSLESLKMKSLRTMFDLFVHNPEQEKYILSCMINKLGDPTPKVASHSAHLLSQILSQHHPQMKMVVVKEVERLLFRPHITDRTQYYCLCFLSEIVFTTKVDEELSNTMCNIYFAIFNQCVKQGDINNKTMSILLTGVSRAFPYSNLDRELLEKYLNTFYRIIHFVSLNTGIQTISLISNLVQFGESGSLTDRFYSTLYRFIQDPQIESSSKCNLLLNVVYRAIKKDPIIKRVRAFIKRLFQVSLLSSSSFVISVLILISETIKEKNGFRLETSFLKHDEDDTILSHESNGIKNGKSKMDVVDENDDDLEIYYDIDEDGQEKKPTETDSTKPSWVFVHKSPDTNGDTSDDNGNGKKTGEKCTHYDIDARNPLYCNADREELWELHLIGRHFHPTTKLFVEKLMKGESIDYDGNPLDDFTVKRFLDRFVFRNPKQNVSNSKKESVEKPTDICTKVFRRRSKNDRSKINALSEADMLNQPEDSIPVDEQFIYRYLRQKKSLRLKGDGLVGDDDDQSDIESVNSLEFNDMLDNYEEYTNDDGIDEIDFAQNFKQNAKKAKKNKRKRSNDDDADEDEEDIDDFDEDEADLDEEFDDDAFSDGDDFGGFDDDDDENDDDDDDGEEPDFDDDDYETMDLGLDDGKTANKARNAAKFSGKKGFSKITNDIFASAEEFSHILDQNESGSDSDFEEIEQDKNVNNKKPSSKSGKDIRKKKIIKRPNLGRKAARRKLKKPRMAVDL